MSTVEELTFQRDRWIKRTWCEIDLDCLKENITLIQSLAKKTVIGVVKANAYGHGDVMIAKELQKAGIHQFAVSSIEEAMDLRLGGIEDDILILGYTAVECAPVLWEYNLIQTVLGLDYALKLNEYLTRSRRVVRCHLAIDTGMGRIGFVQRENQSCLDQLEQLKGLHQLHIEGVFTHFAMADSFRPVCQATTRTQVERFHQVVEYLQQQREFPLRMVHCQNSAGLTNFQVDFCNAVRAGIILYGLDPSDDVRPDVHFHPIMSLKSTVSNVKILPAGNAVSYGGTYVTQKDTRIATIAIGYADGYPRALSNRAEVLIRGVRCPIVGRVCMDQLMVDASAVPSVQEGDTVTLFGRDGEMVLPVDELASLCGTINYELTCAMSRRVPRVYTQGGQVVRIVGYLGTYEKEEREGAEPAYVRIYR